MSIQLDIPLGARRLKAAIWLGSGTPTLPIERAEALFPLDSRPRMLELHAVDGNVSFYETYILNCAVRHVNPQFVFEFGTFDGRTLLNIVANAERLKCAYSLDLPCDLMNSTALPLNRKERRYVDKQRSGERIFQPAHDILRQSIQLLSGDSATFDYSAYEGRIDLVFVDASHEYEYVMNDSRHALSLLAPSGGLILWHDYGHWQGVTRALDHLQRADDKFQTLVHIADTTLAMLHVHAADR